MPDDGISTDSEDYVRGKGLYLCQIKEWGELREYLPPHLEITI